MARSRKTKTESQPETTDDIVSEGAEAADASRSQVEMDEPGGSDDNATPSDADPVLHEAAGGESAADPSDNAAKVDDAEPGASLAPSPAAEPQPRRPGFFAPVLGGVVAAGLGFGLASYILPKVWTPGVTADEIAALAAGLKAEEGRTSALAKDVKALSATPAASAEDVAAMEARLSDQVSHLSDGANAAAERLTELAAQLAVLDNRLAELEKRPVEGGAASATAIEAFGREMDELRKEIDAQRADAAAAQERISAMADDAAARLESAQQDAEIQRQQAADAARQTAIRAAVGRLQAALESGGTLEGGLSDLSAAGVDVPPTLAEQAHGVPSLAALREAFPPAARDALSASLKEQVDGGMWNRVTAFMRSQSGARSLSPRAGDDPDAVLSRAEAALGVGDLATAINEIGTLSEDGQARMAEWVTLAERRLAAIDAIAALAAEHK